MKVFNYGLAYWWCSKYSSVNFDSLYELNALLIASKNYVVWKKRLKVYVVYELQMSNNKKVNMKFSFQLTYTLKPLDLLLPLALSNFLPVDKILGALPLCGPIPKCLTASLEFLGPLKIKVFWPFGALTANWSKVIHSPPALTILALAPAVNLKAATVVFGNSKILASSVTVPTTTTVLLAAPSCFKALAILETETGGLLILDKNKAFKTTLLNGASVRPKKKNEKMLVTNGSKDRKTIVFRTNISLN